MLQQQPFFGYVLLGKSKEYFVLKTLFLKILVLVLSGGYFNHEAKGAVYSGDPDVVITVQFKHELAVTVSRGVLQFENGSGVPDELKQILNSLEWVSPYGDNYLSLRDKYKETTGSKKSTRIRDVSSRFNARLTPSGIDLQEIISSLRRYEEVEYVYRIPDVVMPPRMVTKERGYMIPPDYESNQGYLNAGPAGVDAHYVWETFGNRGSGVSIVDIEYDFSMTHHDLPDVNVIGGVPYTGFGNHHGTAVIGQYGSLQNNFGTTGIASDATCHFHYAFINSFNLDYGTAVVNSAAALNPGDIILVEAQTGGPNYSGSGQDGLIPIEWFEPWYDGVVFAVDVYDVVVIETAGNGGENLDAAIYTNHPDAPHNPFLPQNNSGAIIVGAGHAPPQFEGSGVARSRMWYSNYGSRLDLQSWGERIYTTGYGSIYNAEGEDYYYTSSFSGTSGATPIVVGAAALLQAQSKNVTGNVLTGRQIRDVFVATGAPQQSGANPVTQHIGPQPDLYAAITYLGLDISGPQNDLCTDAIEVFCGDFISSDIYTATSSDAPVSCEDIETGAGVWYVYEGDDQIITLSLCGSSFDTQIGVYEGGCNNLNCVASNDDHCGTQSLISFMAETGKQYYIYVSGKSGETGDFSLEVSCFDCSTVSYNIESVSTSCGLDNGSINVTAGGTGGYSILWEDGVTSAERANLATGVYSATITTDEGCQIQFSEFIGDSEATEVIIYSENTSCGLDNGIAEVVQPLGANTFYSWSNGAYDYLLWDLPYGDYSVTVVDDDGCIGEGTVHIENSYPVDFYYETDHTRCGLSNGSIHIEPFGGYGFYEFVWSNGTHEQSIGNLSPGFYGVTVSSGICFAEKVIEILPSSELEVVVDVIHESCLGCNDGSLTVSDPLGSGYTYFWSNSEATSSINNLAPGIYTLLVEDDNGCQFYGEYTILAFGCQGVTFELEFFVENVSCFGESGSVEVLVSGGEIPYSYSWDTGSVTAQITAPAGIYVVTVTDSKGCSGIGMVEITQPDMLATESDIVNETCFFDCSGSIELSVGGGVAPYSFLWSHKEHTGQNFYNLCEGDYTVTVTDVNGCIEIRSFSVAPGLYLDYLLDGGTFICHGDTGVLRVYGEYSSIWWSTGSSEREIFWTESDTIYFQVQNDEGCSNEGEVKVTKNEELYLNLYESGDSIFAEVWGGSAPYQYLWSNGDVTGYIVPEESGDYSVVVTDQFNCEVTGEISFTTSASYVNRNDELIIFPNPVTVLLHLSVPDNIHSGELSVLSVEGKVFYQSEKWTDRLDVAALSPGMYVVRLKSGNKTYHSKFIKVN